MSISVKFYWVREENVERIFFFFSLLFTHSTNFNSLLHREKDETKVKGCIQQKWKTGREKSWFSKKKMLSMCEWERKDSSSQFFHGKYSALSQKFSTQHNENVSRKHFLFFLFILPLFTHQLNLNKCRRCLFRRTIAFCDDLCIHFYFLVGVLFSTKTLCRSDFILKMIQDFIFWHSSLLFRWWFFSWKRKRERSISGSSSSGRIVIKNQYFFQHELSRMLYINKNVSLGVDYAVCIARRKLLLNCFSFKFHINHYTSLSLSLLLIFFLALAAAPFKNQE
jgi:hypothetical protein